jgi:hypothetical protein
MPGDCAAPSRLPDADQAWADKIAANQDPPLTTEMLDSLIRLRRRIQDMLFPPETPRRPRLQLLPPVN